MADKFVWYDLMTTDLEAAKKFYGDVVGWRAEDAGIPGRPPYLVLSNGTGMAGGMMSMPEGAAAQGARPGWLGHIGVPDVDAYATRVTAAGGTIYRAPEDIPGIGRFAVAGDPHGATFVLFHPNGEASPEPPAGDPGRIGWHELHAGDGGAAWTFYSELFGWSKAEAVDMGPMGVYQTFATGSLPVGGMVTKMPEMPMPFWLYYINVDSIDGATERSKSAGGTLVAGPHQVPGGSWIAQCMDPQGAMFAMVSMQR